MQTLVGGALAARHSVAGFHSRASSHAQMDYSPHTKSTVGDVSRGSAGPSPEHTMHVLVTPPLEDAFEYQ